MKLRGQNLIEFLIIIALVVISGIVVLNILGLNINKMFSNAYSSSKQYKPFEWNTSTSSPAAQAQQGTFSMDTESSFSGNLITINGIDVQMNEDGSANFMVGNQMIHLSKEIVDLQDTVTEAVGSEGLEDLIPEIAYFINKHKAEYEPGEVPLQISFGTGDRNMMAGVNAFSYKGDAVVNSVGLKIGDNLLILQNDQDMTTGSPLLSSGMSSCASKVNLCSGDFTNMQGLYRLEGKIEAGNHFVGNYINKNNSSIHGSYSADIDDSSGIVFNNSTYTSTFIPEGYQTSTWNLNFSDSNLHFNLTQ